MVINGEIKFLDREVTRMGKKIKEKQSSVFERARPQNSRHQEEVHMLCACSIVFTFDATNHWLSQHVVHRCLFHVSFAIGSEMFATSTEDSVGGGPRSNSCM